MRWSENVQKSEENKNKDTKPQVSTLWGVFLCLIIRRYFSLKSLNGRSAN